MRRGSAASFSQECSAVRLDPFSCALGTWIRRRQVTINQPSVEQMHDALGVFRESRIVGHDADGRATLVQFSEELHD